MTPGQRLQKLRIQKSLQQQDLAAQLGYKTPSIIARWESNHRLPKAKDLKALAQFFGVSADYLLGLDKFKHPQ